MLNRTQIYVSGFAAAVLITKYLDDKLPKNRDKVVENPMLGVFGIGLLWPLTLPLLIVLLIVYFFKFRRNANRIKKTDTETTDSSTGKSED